MRRPHLTLKLATSLDGRIATASGESRWITGEAARAEVHRMRAETDAVMIGAGTARADNPSLLARTEPAATRQPMRVVVTTKLDLLPEGALFENIDQSPLVIFCRERTGPAYHAILEAAGAQIVQVPAKDAGLDMPLVFERLSGSGVGRVLAEGGGKLAAALIAADLVDRLEWFRAPLLLGADAKPGVGDLTLSTLANAPHWRRVAVRELGPDLWESYERG